MNRVSAAPEAALDAALGDRAQTWRWSADGDRTEDYPSKYSARLDAFGLHRYYAPPEWGGASDDHEVMLRLWRTVARRDLAATVAHGKTYLGTAPVWIAARPEQAAAVADAVLSGAPVGCALSEPEHGADLVNGSVTATAHDGGFRLEGVKWPINNGTRSTHLTVLTRTADASTARSHSMFLIDRAALPPGSWRQLPKVRTHGLRTLDLSGISFSGAQIPASALLGAEGTGIEIALKSLQLTRTMCAAMSLGAAEHALRLVAEPGPRLDEPRGPEVVARCAALLAAAEAATLVGARSVHGLTGELSVTSAVVKSVAPALADRVIGELAELLGPRAWSMDGPGQGAFQKLARDHDVVSVFDGSTPVNRASLIGQFPRLARRLASGEHDGDGLAEAAAIGVPPRRLDRGALSLASRTGCSVLQGLADVAASDPVRADPGLSRQAAGLHATTLRLSSLMSQVRPAPRPPMAAYELAAAYELCFAGAACLHLWSARADLRFVEPLWQDALWVRAALYALSGPLAELLGEPRPDPSPDEQRILGRLSTAILTAAADSGPVTPFGTAL